VLARLTAVILRELAAPVIAEWQRLDALEAGAACERPHADGPPPSLPSVTCASTERANGWDHDTRQPVTAAGFRLPGK